MAGYNANNTNAVDVCKQIGPRRNRACFDRRPVKADFFTELWGKLIGVWIEGEKIALFGRALIIDDYLIRNRKGHRAVCSQQRGVWELQISLHQLPSGFSFAEKRTVARKMWKKKTQRLLLVFANKNKVWDNNTEQVVVAHNSASERKRTVMRHSLCTNALLYLKSPLWKKICFLCTFW